MEESSCEVFYISQNLQTSSSPEHLILHSPEVSWVIKNTSVSWCDQNNKSFLCSLCHTCDDLPLSPSLSLSPPFHLLPYPTALLRLPWLPRLPVLLLRHQSWTVKPSSQLTLSQHPSAIQNRRITPKLSCTPIRHICPTHLPFHSYSEFWLLTYISQNPNTSPHTYFRTGQDRNE